MFTRFRSSGRLAIDESRSARRGERRWAGEQTAKATGTAVCGESYRLRPAKGTQPSLVGGRRRPCLCLVPPPDAPAHTGRAHVTLTFGSQVYYQYYDGVSRYVRLRLGIPSRLPPACPRRGSLLKPSARALQPLPCSGLSRFHRTLRTHSDSHRELLHEPIPQGILDKV